jgi:threonine dehydrogenase-like Zn-dependent dehydrogenase
MSELLCWGTAGYGSARRRTQGPGAAGLLQSVVESAEMAARIHCAGGWYTGGTLDITTGGPHSQGRYGTLDAIASGRLDPLPNVGKIIGLGEVPGAIELAWRSDGPPRIVLHPNGDVP